MDSPAVEAGVGDFRADKLSFEKRKFSKEN